MSSITSEIVAQRMLPYLAGKQFSPRLLLDHELVSGRIVPDGLEEELLRKASGLADSLLFVTNLRNPEDQEILDRVMWVYDLVYVKVKMFVYFCIIIYVHC